MPFLYVIFFIILGSSCGGHSIQNSTANVSIIDSIPTDTALSSYDAAILDTIWGYRFQITGDFDGNGELDTLTERYIDPNTDLESNKFFGDLDILVYQRNQYFPRVSFLESNTPAIDTLSNLGDLGVSWLENIGDVNGDGADEIALIHYHGDYSNINDCYIYSYIEDEWQSIYVFAIHELSYPDLPSTSFLENTPTQPTKEDIQLEKLIQQFKTIARIDEYTIEVNSTPPYPCDTTYRLANILVDADSNFCWITAPVKEDFSFIEQINVKYPNPSEKELVSLRDSSFTLNDFSVNYTFNITFKPTP
jgi:hypothetical protein